MKFYFVYSLILVYGRNVYGWTDSKIQGCYMSLYSSYVMQLYGVLSIILSDLQFTTSKCAISISYILIMNVISMKDIYGYQQYVAHFVAF